VLYAAWRHLGHLLAADPQLTTGIRARTRMEDGLPPVFYIDQSDPERCAAQAVRRRGVVAELLAETEQEAIHDRGGT
jgi:hypothetical protein